MEESLPMSHPKRLSTSQLEEKVDESLVRCLGLLAGIGTIADHAVWGRQDLALTVLGEPAAGTAVGM
jgi:hypothetical protein